MLHEQLINNSYRITGKYREAKCQEKFLILVNKENILKGKKKNGRKGIVDEWNNAKTVRCKTEHSVLRRERSPNRPWEPHKKGSVSFIFIFFPLI